ncbi:MAG TPA: hypothetical protein VEH76_03415 [Methylocystis sp.]|nr:hypothetical protein [Methylocystis sp.]
MPQAQGPRQAGTKSKASEERAKRARAILNMRARGLRPSKIADELPAMGHAKVSISQVRRIIRAALAEAAHRPAEELLRIELSRLDELQEALYAKAVAGEAPAMDRVLAIMDRRAKLLGLHQPRKAESESGAAESARAALLEKLNTIAERLKAAAIRA